MEEGFSSKEKTPACSKLNHRMVKYFLRLYDVFDLICHKREDAYLSDYTPHAALNAVIVLVGGCFAVRLISGQA